jgi:SAM-dependent methyltransferase
MKCLLRGQSLLRIRMNQSLSHVSIHGRVLDVGGGRSPDYFSYVKQEAVTSIEAIDGSITSIDFEKDALPYTAGSVDTVISCNVLEHIFHHVFHLSELRRILSPEGKLVGFVPFWTGYHPDPHDYFRYTGEALKLLLEEAGFKNIEIQEVGGGPILANFNTIVLSVPRITRPILYIWYAIMNTLFISLRPASEKRNPLGYVFTATPEYA